MELRGLRNEKKNFIIFYDVDGFRLRGEKGAVGC